MQFLDVLLKPIIGNQTKIKESKINPSGKYPVITQEKDKIISGYTDNENIIDDLPLIVFGDHSCTVKYIDFPFIRGADGTQLLKVNQKDIITQYHFYVLQDTYIENSDRYDRHYKYLKNIKIPLPPLDVQQQIVAECEKVDEEYNTVQKTIEENKRKIEKLMSEVKGEMKRLGSVISLEYGKALPENKRITGQYPVMGSNGIIGYHNEFLVEGPSIIVGRKGSAGAVNWVEENNFPIDTTYYVHLLTDTMDLKFVYYSIANIGLETMNSSIGVPGLNRNDAYAINIPVPSLEEQQCIVQEIETYEAEIVSAKAVLSACAEKKKMILDKWL